MPQILKQAEADPAGLLARYNEVRDTSTALAAALAPEDMVVQTMDDVSPAKWHLAHVTWFFETFVLKSRDGYQVFHPQFEVLFNSYYNAVGPQYPRPRRGLLSRPTVEQVMEYRAYVDQAMTAALAGDMLDPDVRAVVELGLHHEQQHQELLLMDIKHVFFQNPLLPVYRDAEPVAAGAGSEFRWLGFEGGESQQGVRTNTGFSFDNEGPRHAVRLAPFELGNRLVTNSEYQEFIEAGGYREPSLWLSDGWALVREEDWQAPFYWVRRDGRWFEFTLHGLHPVQPNTPVSHLSFFEADAYASWRQARLPTESEWEFVAAGLPVTGNFLDDPWLGPMAAAGEGLQQVFGDLWEWTASPYQAYPGFRPAAGALGEYNGKFMCSQMVLRGGCAVTPAGHVRASYRNFFYPHQRWMFSGVRLARDAAAG